MIKKINQLFEDMPLIIKLIIGIILVGILTCMTMFIKIANVSAATLDFNYYGSIHSPLSATWYDVNIGDPYSYNALISYDAYNWQVRNTVAGAGAGIINIRFSHANSNINCSYLDNNKISINDGQNVIQYSVSNNGCSYNSNTHELQKSYKVMFNTLGNNTYNITLSTDSLFFSGDVTMSGYFRIEEQGTVKVEDLNNTAINIINSAIQNALDTIQNNDENTNAIITMINTLTNSITGNVQTAIENTNQICETIDKNNIKEDNKYLNAVGEIGQANGYGVTDYIIIKDKTISYLEMGQTRLCYYDKNKTFINCQQNNLLIQIPENTYYMRSTILKSSNVPQYKICSSKEQWQNEQDDRRISSVIAEMVQNATDQIQSTVDNSTDIISQINSSATNIINEMQSKVSNALKGTNIICNNETLDLSDKISNWNIALNSSGQIITQNNSSVTRFIKLNKGNSYTYTRNFIGGSIHYCLYDSDKTLKQCYEIPANDDTVNFQNNNEDLYVRFTVTEPVNGNITQTLSGLFCNTVAEIQALAVEEIRETTDTLVNTIRQTDTTCTHISKDMQFFRDKTFFYINTNGEEVSNNHYALFSMYPLYKSVYHIKYTDKYNYVNNAAYCLYGINKDLISCVNISNNYSSFTIDNSNQDYYYVTVSVPYEGVETLNQQIIWTDYCATTPGINAAIGDLSIWQQQRAWTIYDEQDDTSIYGLTGFFEKIKVLLTSEMVTDPTATLNRLNQQFNSNNNISRLLLLPVTMLQTFDEKFSGICTDYSLGSLYGTELVIPCIDPKDYVGNTIWNFYDLVITGILILSIRKKFIQIYWGLVTLSMERNELE